MIKTVVLSAALSMPLAANSIIFCSGQSPTEHSNSGYAIEILGPSTFGCGNYVTTPGLDPAWETGIDYIAEIPNIENIQSVTAGIDITNGSGFQIGGWFAEHDSFSGILTVNVPLEYISSETHAAAFGYGEFQEANYLLVNYREETTAPEPASWIGMLCGMLLLFIGKFKYARKSV